MVFKYLLFAIALSQVCLVLPQGADTNSHIVIPQNYVKEIRPNAAEGKPVTVKVIIYIIDVSSVNSEDMDFRVDMLLRLSWRDPRLQLMSNANNGQNFAILPAEFLEKLWHPDPFISNAKHTEINYLNDKHASIALFGNGSLHYTVRMHAKLACQMDFRFYPVDYQNCPMNLESFLYDEHRVSFQWDSSSVEPISVNPDLRLLQYVLIEPLNRTQLIKRRTTGGNFSRLVCYFRFERQLGHHMMQTFLPSMLIVSLSWFSFWLGLDAVPGRISLLVTSLLTLVTMFTTRSEAPKVAYIKSIDLWVAACLLFHFAAITEFIIVRVLDSWQKTAKLNPIGIPSKLTVLNGNDRALSESKDALLQDIPPKKFNEKICTVLRNTRQRILPLWNNPKGEQSPTFSSPSKSPRRTVRQKRKITPQDIDKASRVLFPLFFGLFLLFYWPLTVLHILP